MSLRVLALGLGLLLIASERPKSLYGDLLGISVNGDLISINTNTGQGTLLGNTGLGGVDAMEFDLASETLLVGSSSNQLYRVNPDDLSTTHVRNLALDGVRAIEDLAFGGSGKLYGAADFFGTSGISQAESLVEIDPTTGTTTFVGFFGNPYSDVDALGASSNDEIYINNLTVTPNLAEVDPNTGAATSIGPSATNIIALEFDVADRLFATLESGGQSHLYTVDPGTGAIQLIGATGFSGVTGLASTASGVPEPSTAWISVTMVMGLLIRGGRQR